MQTTTINAGFPTLPRAVKGLLTANIIVFVLQMFFDGQGAITAAFGLVPAAVRGGAVWQLVTYMFLHASLFHIFFNMLALYFFGSEVERALGSRTFLLLYGMCGLIGAVGWVLIHSDGPSCVGASGAVFGVVAAFISMFPHRQITLLLFFILPVTMRAWFLGVILIVTETFYLISGVQGNIANLVHLAGGVAGYVYVVFILKKSASTVYGGGAIQRHIRSIRQQSVLKKESKQSEEIDRILGKVSREGIHSLTAHERAVLERASRNRRSR